MKVTHRKTVFIAVLLGHTQLNYAALGNCSGTKAKPAPTVTNDAKSL